MQSHTSASGSNLLLESLSARDRRSLQACGQIVELALGEVLGAPGGRVATVFFPLDSYISLIAPVDGEARLEVGLVGAEGMLGVSRILGLDLTPLHAVVQGAGSAWRLDAVRFSKVLARSQGMQRIFNRYVYVTLGQLAQTAACTRFHLVPARLARWLLMTGDRAHSNRFAMTHTFLAYMLGVRRVGITAAASALRARKLIQYTRGQIVILDVPGLKLASCSCYAADRRAYQLAFEQT